MVQAGLRIALLWCISDNGQREFVAGKHPVLLNGTWRQSAAVNAKRALVTCKAAAREVVA